ncbi:MAG: hypothetical protein H6718_00835 [Polyangiaceae bacterium]|nr:hypothetical protein [Myxococcales bacterium]MCB9583908.1 hypothetical protein [Polyangiaceae bacterium]MCB9607836.1 hypothetical protein [Polyangiaceae bacterium]
MRVGFLGCAACLVYLAGCGSDDRPARLGGGNGGSSSFGGNGAKGGSAGTSTAGAAGSATGGAAGSSGAAGSAVGGSSAGGAGASGGAGNAGGTGGTIPSGPLDGNVVYRVSQLRGAPPGSTVICPTRSEGPITAAPGVESATRAWVHPGNGNLYYLRGGSIRVVTPNPLTDDGNGNYIYPDLLQALDDDLELPFSCPRGTLVDFVLDQGGNAYLACTDSTETNWYTEGGSPYTACVHDAASRPVAFGTDGSVHCNSRLISGAGALGISDYWSEEQALAIRANPADGGFRTGNQAPGNTTVVELYQLNLSGTALLNAIDLGVAYPQLGSCALTRNGNLECIAIPVSAPARLLTFGPTGDESPLSDDADQPPCTITDAFLVTGP